MDQASLPLSYHCRNARLYLKKAAFCKKSALFSDELSHLRKFETLVSSTIPSHPLFSISSKEKQVSELLVCLSDCRERIHALETAKSLDTESPLAYKTPSQSPTPTLMSKKGKMPGSIRGAPSDSPTSSRRPSLGSGDSPSKKQQSWGIWTANPQHDASQLAGNSPIGFGGLSPPSSRKRAIQRGKKPVVAAEKEPIVVPALPLRSIGSADQRLQSMIGGCALVANQLQQLGEKKHDSRTKAPIEAESSLAPESKARSANIHIEGPSKRPLEWLLSSSRGMYNSGSAQEHAITPPWHEDRDQKSPDKGTQSFRFSPQFLEKRLKDRMAQLQRKCLDTDEDGSASSPAKVRMSSDRLTGDMLLNEEEGSSAEESAGHGASSSTLEMFAKHLNHGTNPTALTAGRIQRMVLVDQEDISTERSQVISSTDDMWAKKLVPVVEQKLCHDMLRRCSSQKATPRSCRKRNRKRGVLGVMDDVIRRAVDSDSALSKAGSPRLLASGQDSSSEIKKGSEVSTSIEQKGSLQRLQSDGLEAKFSTLQDLVVELRRCMEGFTARVEAEGERWQNEMQGLEKNMYMWRENAQDEMAGIKKALRDEMQKMMDEVRIGLIRVERLLEEAENSRQELEFKQQPKEERGTSMEMIQRSLESMVASMKVDLLFELKEKVTSGMRRNLDVVELGISKQFEGMQREMTSTLAETEKARRLEKQEIDALIDEKMEKRLSQRLEIVSGGKEKVIADMKNELRLLWVEVDMLSKGREEMKDTVDQLAHIAEEAKHSIGEEQNALKHENGMLKKQLQYFKKESTQMRADNEDFKKDIELEVEHIRLSLERVKAEEQSMKTVLDRVMECEELGRKKVEDNGDNNESARERMLIMEKVEGISQFYLGGLEEVRSELLSFKLECVDRMGELEGHCAEIAKCQHEQETKGASDAQLPLEELVLDGLESRVSHLESCYDQISNLEDDRLRILAAMEKDREETSAALGHVASAAQKADEFVAEMVRSFSSELTTVMRQSHQIQENLAAERDMAVASAGEVKRMSEDMDREMQVAMTVISEAQAKGLQMKEGLENEISVLKESLVLEKEVIAAAAANATGAASNAEAALLEIRRMQSESIAMSEDIAEAAGHACMTYNKELECHLEEWKKMMLIEVTRAQSLVDDMEKDKQRIKGFADSCGEDKWVSSEALEQYVKRTEDAVVALEGNMKEVSASMEVHSAKMQADTEQKGARLRHDIDELREKVGEAFTRLEEASGKNQRLDSDLHASLQKADDLLQNVKNLDSKMNETLSAQAQASQSMKTLESHMSEAISAHADTAEKVDECSKRVHKLESMQLSVSSSVEGVQASTGDLQKSVAVWLQKYDAAARLLQDLDKRISTLESTGLSGSSEHRLDGVDVGENMQSSQKERLFSLYNELSGFVQRMKAREDREGQGDDKDGAGWSPVDTRLVSLEKRVVQVETETFSNLRVLDAKMEDFSVGVQTALEGASMAESKCSALGGELVKLFRMIATNRKESPSKMMMMMEVTTGSEELNNEQQQQHPQTQQQLQQPSTRTGHAVSVKGDVEERSPAGFERNFKVSTTHHGKQSPQHNVTSREASPTLKITRQQLQKDKEESVNLETMWRRATSDTRILEGKLPITVDERRVEGKKLEGVQIRSGKAELQVANIRLDDGKVQVNVSHRPPSSLTAMRVMKRGDAMSAAQP
ncbi:hypothetical protein GOP47_0012599 [Adiantum capillus-veneris]|uniref:Uncharacterized protein n=1 Tax=Adiantum capillus-veneris TaxID=13818 RepID=A0A9D4UQZ9_ADICA|nr:hypothetical protein GOP47_0012599 [Adiantum capillus-veneris]